VTETFPLLCHRCGCTLTPGEASFYVVRIEAFADPSPPVDHGETVEEITAELNELIARASDLSEQELMDQVYRKMTLLLCNACYKDWIEDPTG
jgi:hypothetical protein